MVVMKKVLCLWNGLSILRGEVQSYLKIYRLYSALVRVNNLINSSVNEPFVELFEIESFASEMRKKLKKN